MPSPSRTVEMINASAQGRARKKKKVDPAVKAARIAAYEARNEALRAVQAGGVNLALVAIRATEAKQAAQAAAAVARVEQAKQTVAVALAGPHGDRLRKWMGQGLKGDPCKVALIVRNWAATQGVRLD